MDCILRRASKVLPLPDAKTTNLIRFVLPALLLFANLEVQAARPSPENLVESIVNSIESAQTHTDWHLLQDGIDRSRALLMSPQVSEQERCQALSALTDEQLLNFYEELSEENAALVFECQHRLKNRTDRFLSIKTDSLSQTYKAIAQQKLSQCSSRTSATFGPEMDYFVDPQQGGILYGDFLPKCGIAFTFDDGPHKTLTPELLKTLEKENLLVNFFVVGDRVKTSPDILRDQHAAGHLIGNHSRTHADLRKLSFQAATKEIEDGFDAITNAIGVYLPFFRFPYGAHTKDLQAYLNHFSRVEFFWNIDTLDWKLKDPEKLYTNALVEIEKTKGGIILMHDIQPQTIAAVPYIFSALRDAGYTPYLIRPATDVKAPRVP